MRHLFCTKRNPFAEKKKKAFFFFFCLVFFLKVNFVSYQWMFVFSVLSMRTRVWKRERPSARLLSESCYVIENVMRILNFDFEYWSRTNLTISHRGNWKVHAIERRQIYLYNPRKMRRFISDPMITMKDFECLFAGSSNILINMSIDKFLFRQKERLLPIKWKFTSSRCFSWQIDVRSLVHIAHCLFRQDAMLTFIFYSNM